MFNKTQTQTETIQITKEIPVLQGSFQQVIQKNGAIIVVTDFGVYNLYRAHKDVPIEIVLEAVFEPQQAVK